MTEFNFDNGDLVIIKKENRLKDCKEFMFGIIVEQVGTQRHDGSKNVSLHILNKKGCLLLANKNHFIPEYVDYNTSELVPYKKANELGYKELVSDATLSVLTMEEKNAE